MRKFPALEVTFDDGRTLTVQIRQADIVRLERHTRTSIDRMDIGAEQLMFLGWTALRRGKVDGIPDDFDVFIDQCEVAATDDESEGKASDPAPVTGF